MSKQLLLPALVALLVAPLCAQQMNPDFAINKINPEFVTTPDYQFSLGPTGKKTGRNKDFLAVEVNFAWLPKLKKPDFLDELTVNYYILLNNKDRENPKGTLLSGSVTHVALPQAKSLNSVMYLSPRSLERFFGGRAPATAASALVDVAVTITQQGQVVAEASWKGKGNWWDQYTATSGYLLNKNQTPFAPLVWDYYEPIKASPGGM